MPANVRIELVEYDPQWPAQFDHEATQIRAALGSSARLIEHVGSTSVSGLPAKPVIDVVVEVADPADESSYVEAVVSAGYRFVLREPAWFEHRLFARDEPRVNLHVFASGSSETRRMLTFRDRLRLSAADRSAYAAMKQELAARTWTSVDAYADAKSEVIQTILHSPS